MPNRERTADLLTALTVVVAFGGLFFGRLMLYPVSIAQGSFLERVAARSSDWHTGHQWMLAGIVAMIPATIGLRRVLRERSPWLTNLATTLTIFGATLTVGQFALDFAMQAAAQIESPDAGAQFLDALKSDAFAQWAFYKLPDVSQLGLILFTVVLWRQGAGWRLQAALVTLASLTFLVGPYFYGAIGVRVALGLMFVGFLTVAWKIAARPTHAIAPRD